MRRLVGGSSTAKVKNKISSGCIVEYEQHSTPILAITISEQSGKWRVLNEHGSELLLAPHRLYLYAHSKEVKSPNDSTDTLSVLIALVAECTELQLACDLQSAWSAINNSTKQIDQDGICGHLEIKDSVAGKIALRRALLQDRIYFKRKKNGLYEPRLPQIVEELKRKALREQERVAKRERLISQTLASLKQTDAPIPEDIRQLHEFAALGKNAQNADESKKIIQEILERAKLNYPGKLEQKTFELLVSIGYFSPDENLIPLRLGRPQAFSEAERRQAEEILSSSNQEVNDSREDFRNLVCLTIDADDSEDFDDALSIDTTPSGYRVGIHISDVSSRIDADSPLDRIARRLGASIYPPLGRIPMLPEHLSDYILSLRAGVERPVMSFFVEFDKNFTITSRSIHLARIQVQHRLTYDDVEDFLSNDQPSSNEDRSLSELLHALWSVSSHCEARRIAQGAIQFNRREMIPSVDSNRQISIAFTDEDKPSRKLVSELMILANETAAQYAQEQSIPFVFRSQENPDFEIEARATEIPDGPAREYFRRGSLKRSVLDNMPASHFGLGLSCYTQVTSPIRRSLDLVSQRQLSHYIREGEALYAPEKLRELIEEIQVGLGEVTYVQRGRTRFWLLRYLMQEEIKELDGVIVRVDGPKPLAELSTIFTLQPFVPKTALPRDPAKARSLIGTPIRLSITSIDPRADTFLLHEI